MEDPKKLEQGIVAKMNQVLEEKDQSIIDLTVDR